MPTCRRKRVVLVEPAQALVDAAARAVPTDAYYLEQTGEIFASYEEYAARLTFYRTKQFQCEVTGKSNLDYFEALESELQEARIMHSRFPEPLKPSILGAVQFQVMGRLDHLVDAVYDRFKDRYFPEERVLVDVSGDKYFARIVKAIPPQGAASPFAKATAHPPLHQIGGDLKVPAKDVNAGDEPGKYNYHIHIIDEERSSDHKLSVKDRETREANRAKWSESLMEVQCGSLSRDRLAFSKSILRRFIRDCVDRDAALASPWIVKTAIAKRYGVTTEMPEEIRKSVETLKKGEIEKRKKVWEDKEGPPSKKQKKEADAAAAAKANSERAEAEKKKKKKPLRYPTEDLDVKLTDRDLKAGAKLTRPVPSRAALPFGDSKETFEAFLMTWNFLISYGYPLHLSTFTLDEFERALRHSVVDPPCLLLAEVHAVLIYNMRTVPFNRHSAVISMNRELPEREYFWKAHHGVTLSELTEAMGDIGNNWERVALRHQEGRDGWEDALVGCIKDHADLDKFPSLHRILVHLLFAPEDEDEDMDSDDAPSTSKRGPLVRSTPYHRYHTLPPADKIAILCFMVNVATSSKAVHAHIEASEEQLTTLRKEKIELGRAKKAHAEDISLLSGEEKPAKGKAATNGASNGNGAAEASSARASSLDSLSDAEDSEAGSAAPSGKANGKAKDLRKKLATTERQAARAKAKGAKATAAELRRLEDEVAKADRRLEAIEREFRRFLGVTRVRPLGRDRFYNRVWWLDGLGSANLIGAGGTVMYGSGRIFVQGPSEFDVELLERREREEKDVHSRRPVEEGKDGVLGVGQWAVYETVDEVTEFLNWLNPKGVRELALKNIINKWWYLIGPGLRRRSNDLENQAKIPDARRSARAATVLNSDILREPYMTWTNRRATTAAQ